MNQALVIAYALGGRIDPAQLQAMVRAGNEKRRTLFVRLADLLFAAVMFFFADLKLTVKKGDKTVDVLATDQGITTDEKLNAVIAGLQQTDKGNRLREFFRPLIVTAAEILAALMAPNEMILGMLSGQAGPLTGTSADPTGWSMPTGPATSAPPRNNLADAPPVNRSAPLGSPSNPIQVDAKKGGL